MNIEEVFRKLRPVMGGQLDVLWQEYLVADVEVRKVIEQTLRVTLAQKLSETFESEHVLLSPPPQEIAAGPYAVGMIHYGRDSLYLSSGDRTTANRRTSSQTLPQKRWCVGPG